MKEMRKSSPGGYTSTTHCPFLAPHSRSFLETARDLSSSCHMLQGRQVVAEGEGFVSAPTVQFSHRNVQLCTLCCGDPVLQYCTV